MQTQNLLSERACGFKSHHRHHAVANRMGFATALSYIRMTFSRPLRPPPVFADILTGYGHKDGEEPMAAPGNGFPQKTARRLRCRARWRFGRAAVRRAFRRGDSQIRPVMRITGRVLSVRGRRRPLRAHAERAGSGFRRRPRLAVRAHAAGHGQRAKGVEQAAGVSRKGAARPGGSGRG